MSGTDLPEKADVLISEIVDRNLVGEGIIPTLEHTLTALVKPNTRILPQSGRLFVRAFECTELHAAYNASEVAGFDVSLFNEFSPCGSSSLMNLNGYILNPLSEPVTAFEFCFTKPGFAERENTIVVSGTRAGVVHGLVAWFQLCVNDSCVIDNSPWRPGDHWSDEVCLLDVPRPLKPSETIQVKATHDMASFHFEPAKPD